MLLANVGVPMIFVTLPVMIVALVPIILLEAAIYRRGLGTSWSQAWRGSAWANVASTFLGIPAAWVLQLVITIAVGGDRGWGLASPLQRLAAVTLQSAWLVPYESQLHWMIPAAACALLVPFLIVSIVIESFVLRKYLQESLRSQVLQKVFLANLASYACLAAFWGAQLWYALGKADLNQTGVGFISEVMRR